MKFQISNFLPHASHRRDKFSKLIFPLILISAVLFFNSYAICAGEYTDNIDKGITLYDKGYFDKAISEFRQAIKLLKDKPDDESKSEALFTAHLYTGMAYLGKGKESLAKEAFRSAYKASPNKTLSAEMYPPKVISLYNEVASQNLASISVKANVSEAEVYVNDEKKGNTPVIIRSLAPGTYVVKVVTPSQQEVVKTVRLEAGKAVNIMADFQTTGSLSVSSDPGSANITLDGRSIGMTPMVIKDIPAGEHTLGISKIGYSDISQKVMVKGKEVKEVTVTLSAAVYAVKINSTPDKAEVFWDDASKGITPVTISDVTPGSHKIRISKEGFEDQSETIEVKTQVTEKTYRLQAYTGGLNISTEPSGAEVFIDNKSIGTTPVNAGSLIAKQHHIKLKKEGYREKEITIVIARDKTAEVNEKLFELDTQKPEVIFEPPSKAIKENKNFIQARVIDNQAVGDVSLMLKMEGEINFQGIKMSSPLKGIYETIIPELYLKKDAVLEYYILACDIQKNCETSGTKETPYRLKVISLEPYTEGFVLDVEPEKNRLTISLGTSDNVKKEDKYIVFRADKELRDPKTGELLQIQELFVGTLRVVELLPKTSYATMDEAVIPVAKNDRIRKLVSAPTGIASEGSHATKIVLKWAPNREPEIRGYRIFKSFAPDGNYKQIAEIEGRDNTIFEDSDDMKEGIAVYYRIAAFNIFNTNGLMSETFIGKTKKGIAPPVGLRSDGIGMREIKLKWDVSKQDPDLEKHILYRSETESGKYTEIGQTGKDIDAFTDNEGLKDGKTYYYKIAGRSVHGTIGELSKAVAAKTKEGPQPPLNIRAYSAMVKSVKIQWDKHSDKDVAGYTVYRNEKESGDFIAVGKTDKPEFLDKNLNDGKNYYYMISSFYSVNSAEILGPTSKPVSAETKRRPSALKDLTAQSGLPRKIILKWNKNKEKDITEYLLYRVSDSKVERSPFARVKAEVHTYTDSELKDSTQYAYAIKAVDADGLESDVSNIASALTKSLPKPPAGIKGQLRDDILTLTWDANKETDIAGYNIYRKTWFKSALLVTTKTNSSEIKLEEKTKSIKIHITAIDRDGMESEPSEAIELSVQ